MKKILSNIWLGMLYLADKRNNVSPPEPIYAVLGLLLILSLAGVFSIGTYAYGNGSDDLARCERTLQSQGYTEIKMTGYRFFGCGRGDWTSQGFTAQSPTGITVEGTVCAGLLKNVTVRLE